jgi:hypothetical protein
MTKSLFNSSFENSMRLLIVLNELNPKATSSETLCAFDILAIYGKFFGVTDANLHGNNPYGLPEYISRRKIVNTFTKELVLLNMVSVISCENGFHYCINEQGKCFVTSLDTQYVTLYRETIKRVISTYGNETEQQLITLIMNRMGGV